MIFRIFHAAFVAGAQMQSLLKEMRININE